MNPDALNQSRLVVYTNAVTQILTHPMKTANFVALVVHRAHASRIKAAYGPWIASQRAIGAAYGSTELGEAFVTHVGAAVEVVLAAIALSNEGVLVTPQLLDRISSEKNGLLSTEEEKTAWRRFRAIFKHLDPLVDDLEAAMTKLYVTEGKKMASIMYELTEKQVPLAAITEHLNTHLYHLLQQSAHLLESHEAMLREFRICHGDEECVHEDATEYADKILEHESEAQAWLERDVQHMTELGHTLAPYASSRVV